MAAAHQIESAILDAIRKDFPVVFLGVAQKRREVPDLSELAKLLRPELDAVVKLMNEKAPARNGTVASGVKLGG
jgi:hypothetical protein